MQRRGKLLAFLGFLTLLSGVSFPSLAQSREPVDRILAVVDDDPILASEIGQIISLKIVDRETNEDDKAFHRRVLDLMIDQKLRFHEVDRFGFADVPIDAVEEELEKIRRDLGGDNALEQSLKEVDLSIQDLRQILARQVMVLIYVEERLGARVFVGLDDIQQYYDDILVPDLVERGEPIPPIQEVREPIRALLREQRMNEEFETWTVNLRAEADVEDFFDSRYSELPPLVHTIN
jgi:peptidyl-prolyl cis-trans isomerase SurA